MNKLEARRRLERTVEKMVAPERPVWRNLLRTFVIVFLLLLAFGVFHIGFGLGR